MSYCSSVLCYSSISSSDIRSVAAAVEATIVLSLLKKLFDANFSVIFLAYCTNDYCCLAYGVFSERFFVNSLYSLWLSKNLVKIKFSEIIPDSSTLPISSSRSISPLWSFFIFSKLCEVFGSSSHKDAISMKEYFLPSCCCLFFSNL